MKGKILLWLLVTVVLIGWDYYHHRDGRKSLIASATFVWIATLATAGMTMRSIVPLFAVHYLLIIAAWAALLLYLWRRTYVWWAFLLPLGTVALLVGLNFLEGSRYDSF